MSEAPPGARSAASLRLLFFGTPEYAAPTLRRLLEGPHAVVGVVTQPDRPRGRGRRPSPSPVARIALEHELTLLRPEKVGDPEVAEKLRALAPDLGVVVAFGQFLPKRIRELPRLGYMVNGHASLLPRHRGAAPIAHAILAGDRETGISVMKVEREMDAGAVAARYPLEIGAEETCGELEERLAALTAHAIAETLDRIAAGRVRWEEQDAARATLAPKLGPEDGRLDFAEPADALARRVRALAPRPGAWTRWQDERLKLLGARAREGATETAPGTVRTDGEEPIEIATGRGWLVPTRLQRAGGRPLAAADFVRGSAIASGARLGESG